jgi:hypothetical protein
MEIGLLIVSLFSMLGVVIWILYRISRLQRSVDQLSMRLEKFWKFYLSHVHYHFNGATSKPEVKEENIEDNHRQYH